MPPQAQEASDRPMKWIEDTLPFRSIQPKRGRRMMLISPFMSVGGADRVNLELLRGLSSRGWDLRSQRRAPTTMRSFRPMRP